MTTNQDPSALAREANNILRARVAELEEMLRDAHRRIEPSANEEGGAWARVLLNDIEEVLTPHPGAPPMPRPIPEIDAALRGKEGT